MFGAMSASRELQRQLRRIEPCLPRPAPRPPTGPGWIHEIKHDGYRIIAERDHGSVRRAAPDATSGQATSANAQSAQARLNVAEERCCY